MIRAILALVFLGIIAAVVNMIPIPAPFTWIIYVLLIICALYIVAALFGLIAQPTWWGGPPL